jgi:sugar (pentulose or hexulose) kinase
MSEDELFSTTVVQTMQINTLFQLYSMVLAEDSKLECAETLLMIPDLFNYFLCGEKAVEYTAASTTQMYTHDTQGWAREMLRSLRIPERILPPVVSPATILSPVSREVMDVCGFANTFPVIAVASHDTASAVASIPNLDVHNAFISSDTWSLMGVELDAPITSPREREFNFTNEGGAGGSTLLMRNIPVCGPCRSVFANGRRKGTSSDVAS